MWTLGAETLSDSSPRIRRTYDIVRQYDQAGNLVRGYMSTQNVNASYRDAWQYVHPIYFRAAANIVVLFDERRGLVRTFDSAAHTFSTFPIDQSGAFAMHVTGFALLPDGSIYATRIEGGVTRFASRGLFKLELNSVQKTSQWHPVPNAQVPGGEKTEPLIGSIVVLLGSDGQDLIYRTQQTPGGAATMSWSTM